MKERHYFTADPKKVIQELGKETLIENLRRMILIRHFEIRAESAYQQGKIGGFFHSYIGQEAIQTSALQACGPNNWWTTTYRCHALALLLGVTPNAIMAELYGRVTGNALGRGGSMHLFSDKLLGGFGIVGDHVPVAAGAGFSLKYQGIKDQASICFLGDGAMAQGAFHEALNLSSLWSLPCIYVIENNLWGMGTGVDRALSIDRLAEDVAPTYNMKAYTLDGTDFFSCYAAFKQAYKEVLENNRPVLIEAIAERFKGHSISDPGLYRSKEDLKKSMEKDPLQIFRHALIKAGVLDEETYKTIDEQEKAKVLASMKYADESPWPDPATLEQDVFAP